MTRRFRDLPLAIKFILLTAVILVVSIGASSSYLIHHQQRLLEGQIHSKVEALGRFFALIAPESILAFDFSTLDDYAAEITARRDILFALVVDTDDQPFTTFVDPDFDLVAGPPGGDPEARMLALRRALSQHPDVLLSAFPITHGDQPLGRLFIVADLRPAQAERSRLLRQQGLFALGGIGLLGLLLFFVFRRQVLRPLHALAAGARRVSAGDFERPVACYSTDELGRLTAAFNQMMEQINQEREQLRKLSRAVEQSPASVVITDTDGVIEYVNPTFSRITGYALEEVIGHKPSILKSGKTPEETYSELWETILKGEVWVGELINRKSNGELYWENATIAPIKDEAGRITHFIGVKEDISLRKDYEQQLFQQANFDPLTGLSNRALSLDRLQQMLSKARRSERPFAVLFIDLDNFKTVNDSLGHEMGDRLLVSVARRLRQVVREGDTLARLGGDEFLLIIDDPEPAQASEAICKKIIDALSAPRVVGGHELHISCSIGITLFPNDGDRPEQLLKNADAAMYQAKAEGRNTYQFFTPALNQEMAKRLRMENQLRRALDRHELTLHYQPIVDPKTGAPILMEALLRWRNKTLGQVSPADFIPLAEEIGEIVPIGRFVLQQATQQLALWRARYGLPQRIAVNLSPRQLTRGDISAQVAEALATAGLPPEALELEITEGLLVDKEHGPLQQLDRLKAMGVRLSIDDFGTGYSALSYLKEFPIDTLKIDRSFVTDIKSDTGECNLIRAIVAMAEGLDLEVIAEGVETEAQRKALSSMGVHRLQGFLFSRPLPAEAAEAYLRAFGRG